ncbi:acyl-CoA dehydrogenase [Rhodococcus sp. W8901]|nr:acyl-CoA dehydrogenase [Rhodococcus sp. W8901]QKT10884.1 acyl-CoA dehydrogenase [Rhodococcus sp. W8901]
MDFTPNDVHRDIAELTNEVLEKTNPLSRVDLDPQLGYDPRVWASLADVGLLSLALPVDLGGDGLGAAEVAAVLHEVSAHGARVPAFAALALGVLPLATHGTVAQRAELLPALATGDSLITGAPSELSDPLTDTPRTTAIRTTSGWELDGLKIAVPFAAQATRVLIPATTPDGTAVFLVDPAAHGVELVPTPTASGQPDYTIRLSGVQVDDSAVLGNDFSGASVASLRTFALVGAVAIGDGALTGALTLTTRHVRTRHQFGKPLASFQAVSQQIADVYIAARTMHLAASAGAWRVTAGLSSDQSLALACHWLTSEALSALRTCHHLHGGMGADITYPLHRHYSTLKDLSRFLGGSEHTRHVLGLDTDSEREPAEKATAQGTFIELTPPQRALQDELRRYFQQLMTPDERATTLVDRHGPVYRDVVRRMGRDGWLGVGWPKEFGGRGFGSIEQHIFVNEAHRADVQLPSVTLQTVGPTLQAFGTDEQKAFFLPKILSGDLHFAIGYSEPDYGTDLASLRTTAVRVGDHYVVNGQKTFTTGGHAADYIWLAVRTDPDAPKHKGISILIVDTRDPGFTWTPIITADGAHHVDVTYYSDVRVPAQMIVGEENQGWQLIVTQLNYERVMLGPAGRIGGLFDQVHAWAAQHDRLDIPDVRSALIETRATERINELLNWQVAAAEANAPIGAADASATKVFGSERIQRLYDQLEQIVALHGDLADPATAELATWLDVQAKRNLVLTFGGGVNEVQRELIAVNGLGLPRVPR